MILFSVLDYTTRDDLSGPLELFILKAYGSRAKLKYPERWWWLYGQAGSFSVVALDDDVLVGHVGAMTVRLAMSNHTVNACWSIDNFVLPAYRGRGIGTALQQKAESMANVTLSTWVSDSNVSIKDRLGNYVLDTLLILVREEVSTDRVDCLIDSPQPTVIAESARSLNEYGLFVEREVNYCQWRFVEQPFANYVQLSTDFGISLVRFCGPMRNSTGMIGDVLPRTKDLKESALLVNISAEWILSNGSNTARFGTTDRDLIAVLLNSETGWRVHSEYPILSSDTGQLKRRTAYSFFSLSDSDLDQFPW